MTVEVDKASRNARRLYAAVSIDAPLSQVWGALTDYEGLGNFIPGVWLRVPFPGFSGAEYVTAGQAHLIFKNISERVILGGGYLLAIRQPLL